jgi:hypothetical protein
VTIVTVLTAVGVPLGAWVAQAALLLVLEVAAAGTADCSAAANPVAPTSSDQQQLHL